MWIKGFWAFLRAFKCWILLCATETWDCSPCMSSLPVVSSTSAGAGELDSFPGILLCVLCTLPSNSSSSSHCLWGLYSSHTWDGAVVELLWLTLCSVSWGEIESVTSKELTQSPNDKSFWLSGLVLCYFSFLEGNCVILQQCWLIFLIQKSESRKKLKTGENFMSQVCSCCFNHCL